MFYKFPIFLESRTINYRKIFMRTIKLLGGPFWVNLFKNYLLHKVKYLMFLDQTIFYGPNEDGPRTGLWKTLVYRVERNDYRYT